MALIENIQREDLNPLEEALAYRRLADEFQLTRSDRRVRVKDQRQSRMPAAAEAAREVRAEVASGIDDGSRARCWRSTAKRTSAARDVIARSCRSARPSRS
jgi:ParB family chromosome partitioning protein